jgi:predicted TIM-barrel fold metal-dependent hydrolase
MNSRNSRRRFTSGALLATSASFFATAANQVLAQPVPSAAQNAAQNATAAVLPLFDAHIHYSHDAWEVVPPKQAVEIMRKAGLKGAFVSSSNDEGTQMLLAAAPDLIVPELRPYRSRGEIGTWVRDPAVTRYMEERLAKYKYVGIGEFHLYGADVDLAVPQRMVAMAKERQLILHAHSDVDAVERLFKLWPDARILWAHSGFDRPEKVREVLRRHPKLWSDLAFRGDHATQGKVDPAWREAFMEFSDRFMIGTDTFTPERWYYIDAHASYSRAWLSDLPLPVRERIAWRNAETLFKGQKA